MSKLLLVLFVSLIILGCSLIWLHEASSNSFLRSNVCAVWGVCSAVVGVFGTIFALGDIFGGVL